MKRPLCPILLIGFNPPEEGQRDLRRCSTECALYDEANKQCSIKTCAETITTVSGQLDDLIALQDDFVPFEEFEDEDDYTYNATA